LSGETVEKREKRVTVQGLKNAIHIPAYKAYATSQHTHRRIIEILVIMTTAQIFPSLSKSSSSIYRASALKQVDYKLRGY